MTKTDNPTYVAVLGDAIGSRALSSERRRALQSALQAALDEVNRRWRSLIAARFAIVLGDQFEGLLVGSKGVWDITHFLRAELAGVDWVIACGSGPIATPLAGTAPQVDGPCFHLAREAWEVAKRDRFVFAFAGFGDVVTGSAAYYSALYWSWTARQRQAATLLRIMQPAGVAERLGVDRSAVSHLARRMGWPLVVAGDALFRNLLETR